MDGGRPAPPLYGHVAPKPDPVHVFYDGDCGLCSAMTSWALRRDTRGRILPTPAQSDEARRRVGPERATRLLEELHTWSEDDGVRSGVEAVASLLVRLHRWGWMGRALLWKPVLAVARPVYRWVARRRGWFSRASCALPARPR